MSRPGSEHASSPRRSSPWVAQILALLVFGPALRADDGLLRLGVTDFPPWFVVEEERITGIVPDALGPILRSLDIELEMSVRPIARLRSEVESGELDCRAMAWEPDDEGRPYDFGRESLYRLAYGAFARREDPSPTLRLPDRPEDFAGLDLRWGLVHGLSYTPELHRLLEEAGPKIRSWENEDNLLHLLEARLDVVIAEPLTFLHLAAEKGVADRIVLVEPSLIVKDYHLACHPASDRAQLLPRIDAGLRELRASEEWDTILSRYLDGERRDLYRQLTRVAVAPAP